MKKNIFILLIILLIKSNLSAQTFNLFQDFDGAPYVSDQEIIFKSTIPTVTISGDIQSEISITVKSDLSNIIFIKASEVVFAANPNGGSKGTVIRPKPRLCIECEKSLVVKQKNDIFLNQTYNNIQIMSRQELIVGYTLFDLSGKTITTEKTTPTSNFIIDTAQLKKAVYIVKIDLGNQQFKTIKFIKN